MPKNRPSGAKQAAEKRRSTGEIAQEHAAGAEAHVDLIAVTARLKSCPVTEHEFFGSKQSLSVAYGVFPQPVKPAFVPSAFSARLKSFPDAMGSERRVFFCPQIENKMARLIQQRITAKCMLSHPSQRARWMGHPAPSIVRTLHNGWESMRPAALKKRRKSANALLSPRENMQLV
jgi:hypothetical protein